MEGLEFLPRFSRLSMPPLNPVLEIWQDVGKNQGRFHPWQSSTEQISLLGKYPLYTCDVESNKLMDISNGVMKMVSRIKMRLYPLNLTEVLTLPQAIHNQKKILARCLPNAANMAAAPLAMLTAFKNNIYEYLCTPYCTDCSFIVYFSQQAYTVFEANICDIQL